MPPPGSPPEDPASRPHKRICTSSSSSSSSIPTQSQMTMPMPNINIPTILNLPTDAVWSLRKRELRNYFLALQEYALNPYPLTPPTQPTTPISPPSFHAAAQIITTQPQAETPSGPLPPFLNLPVEIRTLIYTHLLSPPSETTIRGPHPRQLQTNITLLQSFSPSILRVNKQVRLEALPVFWGAPTQTIGITVDYNVWMHKKRRSELVLGSAVTSCIRHVHLAIHLGCEKRNNKPGAIEADARMTEVKKGVRKLGKWLGGADVRSLRVSWQEPPQTYTWEQKKGVLDGVRELRAVEVRAGEINWGLDWNKGRRYRFEVEYLKELERGREAPQVEDGGGGADLEMVISR